MWIVKNLKRSLFQRNSHDFPLRAQSRHHYVCCCSKWTRILVTNTTVWTNKFKIFQKKESVNLRFRILRGQEKITLKVYNGAAWKLSRTDKVTFLAFKNWFTLSTFSVSTLISTRTILFLRFDRNVGGGMFTNYLLEITNSIQARFQETEIWIWQIKRALLCMIRALITVGVHKRLEKYY